MAINFFPNDPLVSVLPMVGKPARAKRPAARAGFDFLHPSKEQTYDPAADLESFLHWQCREATLAAVEAWELIDGPLKRWSADAKNPSKLEVDCNHEDPQYQGPQKLNAFYDRTGLRFFVLESEGVVYASGMSTDTVTHEAGHALLDAMRPEFFFSNRPEVNAFHESFGDCWAIITALCDKDTRTQLLRSTTDLRSANFVESLCESLADSVRTVMGNVAPSLPRRALNQYAYQLPTTLPAGSFYDAPALLSAEPHSFSRVFTGCFYDTLTEMLAGTQGREADLLATTVSIGKLLIAATRAARHTSRFYTEVGARMLEADRALFGGAHTNAIRKGFAAHAIPLGSSTVASAPTMALAGPAPVMRRASATLGTSTLNDLRKRLGSAPRARLAVNSLEVAGERVAEVTALRPVRLDGISPKLKGVVAMSEEAVRVGAAGRSAAVLGAMPNPSRAEDEVRSFVKTLVETDSIAWSEAPSRRAPARAARGAVARRGASSVPIPTHVVLSKGGQQVLERVRFVCGSSCATFRRW